MHILVCDDSREDLESISIIIENFYNNASDNSVAAPYSLSRFLSPMDVLSYIEDGNVVDVVILDIMMPKMNGMELASGLRKIGFEGYLIFLTSFNDFAEQSYSVKAFSYIVKPAKQEKVFELLRNIEHTRRITDRNGFSLTRRNGTRLILFSELMYVEVKNHQLFFHLIDGDVVSVYAALKDYSEILLREEQILKPQKSFIVNLDYVRSCENSALIMRDGARISVPKNFDMVKEKWLERMFGQGGW